MRKYSCLQLQKRTSVIIATTIKWIVIFKGLGKEYISFESGSSKQMRQMLLIRDGLFLRRVIAIRLANAAINVFNSLSL